MPGQQAASRLPAKPAGLPLRSAGAKTDAAGAKTDAAGAKTDAAGAKADAASARTDAPTPSQSQDDVVITATSPSVSPANADASPARPGAAQQPEQSQEADMTATPEFYFDSAVRRLKPHSIVALFDGGDFDAGYNDKYKAVEFVTPPGLQKAVLEAVITGILGISIPNLYLVYLYYNYTWCTWHAPQSTVDICQLHGTHVVRMWYACGTHAVSMWQAFVNVTTCYKHGPA